MNKKTEKLIATLFFVLIAKNIISESELNELEVLINADEELTEEFAYKLMGVLTK